VPVQTESNEENANMATTKTKTQDEVYAEIMQDGEQFRKDNPQLGLTLQDAVCRIMTPARYEEYRNAPLGDSPRPADPSQYPDLWSERPTAKAVYDLIAARAKQIHAENRTMTEHQAFAEAWDEDPQRKQAYYMADRLDRAKAQRVK
jgi:hypothetical protein